MKLSLPLLKLPFSNTEDRPQRPAGYRPNTPAKALTTSLSCFKALKIVQPLLGLADRHPSLPKLPKPRGTSSLSSLKRGGLSYYEKSSSPSFTCISKVPYQTIAEFLMKGPTSKELTWIGPATQSNAPLSKPARRRTVIDYGLKRVQIRLPTLTQEPSSTREVSYC